MRLSIGFMGFGNIGATVPAVQAAEQAGLDGAWSCEHIGFHDAVVPSAVYLRETERIEVGLSGLSTAGRHPGLIAMELLSLSELGGGRVRVAVGTGEPVLVAKLGQPVHKPLAGNAAFVTSLREAMRGADLTVEHPEFTFQRFRAMPYAPPVPIDLMAIRPKMVRLSARIADGLSISMGGSRRYIRETVADVTRELAALGRPRDSFRISAIALGVVADDLAAAFEPVRAMLAMVPQETAEYLARGVVEPGSLVEAERHGPAAVMNAWTADAIAGTSLACTPDGLRAGLAAYAETGIDDLHVILAGDPQTHPAIVELMATARP